MIFLFPAMGDGVLGSTSLTHAKALIDYNNRCLKIGEHIVSLKFKIPTDNNLSKDDITASHSSLDSRDSLNVNFETEIDNDFIDYYSNYKIAILNSDT